MGSKKSKARSEAKSVKARQVFPQDTNHLNTMFGGTLMANVDEIAAICAMKHSNTTVVTASTDSVDFLQPIKSGDILSYEAMVSHAGTTSMEVCVQIIIEDVIKEEKQLAALSFLTFVALDQNGKPTSIPSVYPETQTEIWFHETAPARVNRRKERRVESKQSIEFLANARNKE